MKKQIALLSIFTIINHTSHAGSGASILKKSSSSSLLTITPKNHAQTEEYEDKSALFNTLAQAIENNQVSFIKQSITNEFTANLTLPGKPTLLQIAILFERTEIVNHLIQKDANVNARNFLGNTALHLAMQLITRKANALQDASSSSIAQSLHTCKPPYETKHQEIIHEPTIPTDDPAYIILYQLLNAGASPLAINHDDKSPLDYSNLEELNTAILNEFIINKYLS